MNQRDHENKHLLLIFSEDSQLQLAFDLTKNVYSLGRSSYCSIKFKSQSVSRHHATIIRKELPTGENFYLLIDGNLEGKRSQNGTLVNGKKITSHQLEDGDVILFGGYENGAIYKQAEKTNRYLGNDSDPEKIVTKKSTTKTRISRDKLQDTLVISEENLQSNLRHKDVERLASFPELSPNPILEFDFKGNVTYSNPAANLCFSEILTDKQANNPLFKNLTINNGQLDGELVIREIQFEEKYYEQYIHYLSKEKVIRSYIFDITKRKETEAQLQYQAYYDSVTRIPNRNYFYLKLTKYLEERKHNRQPLAILFIDIDRFKNINDTLSHSIGDKLLEYFSYRLVSSLPSKYFLARWGGDEFILIAPLSGNSTSNGNSGSPTTADEVTQIILQSLKEPFAIEQHTVYITCSIGVSLYPEHGLDDKHLVKNADIALFKAKQMGRNKSQIYTSHLNHEQTLLFELEHHLYNAIPNNELFLTFQPQLNLENKKIVGLEALLRWQNPHFDLISPAKFIPLAEETGLIIPIGEWVLESACRQVKQWQTLGFSEMSVAVNVSAKQFQAENFVHQVKEILAKTKLAPQYLELEITESLLIEDLERSEYIISELSGLGVNFALDDFGTGYSSLSYLKKFPFHTVKIDKSFVDDLAINPQDQALVSAVITIAKSYNMMVVAEGVETKEQKQILKKLYCDVIQGWYISKALTENDLLSYLQEIHLSN